jgi:NADPH:quinone reductase-like Zn-dependent oxidoreductase
MALREVGNVEAGERVLVIGASGGVGTFAVQIAKALGAEVTGVASTSKLDLVREIGADHAIDYTQEDFAERPERYDLILDIGGNRSLSHLRRSLTPEGRLVIVGGEGGGKWFGGIDRQLRAAVLSRFVRHTLRFFISNVDADDLASLHALIEAGAIAPVVDRTFTLDEAPDAIRYLRAGRARGKVVVTV